MAVKSVIDIEINDAEFKRFQALFDKYQAQLARMPGAWKAAGAEAKGLRSSFEGVAAALMAQGELARQVAREEKNSAKSADEQHRAWRGIAQYTKQAAASIGETTRSLLKWTALTSVFSGLLGAGGLFGIERLAGSVGAGRRGAQGLGVSYGERQAFGLNYGRVVDSSSFLSGVNESLTDVTKRGALYGAGLGEGDLQGKSTADVAVALLPKLKAILDRTPDALLGQVHQAYGMGQFISIEDAQRLKRTSSGELAGFGAGWNRDKKALDLGDATARQWQDLSVQLGRAGQEIENVFVRGLAPLTPQIEKLSAVVVEVIEKWSGKLGPAIDTFATYLGSDKFQTDVKTFVDGIAALAHVVAGALRYFGLTPSSKTSAGPSSYPNVGPPRMSPWDSTKYLFNGQAPFNNPGNLRVPGSSVQFQRFGTPEAGWQAMSNQLLRDQDVHHQMTMRQIIGGNKEWPGWAPAGDGNNVEAYLKDIKQRTGVDPDQRVDMHDPETRAAVMAAMAHHENSQVNVPKEVIITILNNTGGNAVVSTSQVAR